MTDNKKALRSNIATAIGAGLVGATAGAGAVLLSDKKNRDRIKKSLQKLKKRGERAAEKVSDTRDRLEKQVREGMGKSDKDES